VFYAGFALPVLAGLGLLLKRLSGPTRRLCASWAAAYFVLNFLSGSLPGPNLLRYNKDLELVAPLACLCLGWLFVTLFARRSRSGRLTALVFGASWLAFGALRAAQYLSERMYLER
jgi:hypothetical protein